MVTEERQKFNSLLITMYTYIHIYVLHSDKIRKYIKFSRRRLYSANI